MLTLQEKAAYAKGWYHRNKEKCREVSRRSWQRRKDIVKGSKKRAIREAKDVPCADCGVKYPYYVMDFDHLRDKVKNISQTTQSWSVARIKNEITKCEIVCSNCHRERTFSRRVVV